MAIVCICGSKNTGFAVCGDALKHLVGLILVPKLGSDGLPNKIDVVVDAAYILSKLQAPLKADRWYAIGNGTVNKNMEVNQGDDQSESYSDGSAAITVEGVMGLENMFIQNGSPEYLDKIKSLACGDLGAYVLDKQGKLIGQILTSDPTSLYPKYINNSTFVVKWQFAGPARLAGNLLSFLFSDTDRVEDIRWIEPADIEGKLTEAQSLFDVTLTAVDTSDTETTVTAKDCFGFPTGEVLGLTDATDWTVTDAGGLDLAISGVTDDNNEGIYIITHASATGVYPITISNGTTPFAKNYDLIPVTVPGP